MPFLRPTLEELVERIEAEVSSRLGVGPLPERGPLEGLVRVFAGQTHAQHGHLDYVARQVVPLQVSAEVLEQWASLFGLERLVATRAQGLVTFTGANGSTIPLNALLVRADGARFRTTATGLIGVLLEVDVAVEAELAGVAGNTAGGTALAISTPIAGVTRAQVEASGLFGGEDRESDQELRERLRDTVSARPQGGSLQDYRAWALEVGGVTRVWVFAGEDFLGPGTVGVTFAADDEPGGPIPVSGLVDLVQARLTDQTRRDSAPVTAQVTTYAPVALPIDFELELTPDTAAVRANVEAALADLILRATGPGETLFLSKIHEAISTAGGEEDHVLVRPAANVVPTSGELPTLGTITFV